MNALLKRLGIPHPIILGPLSGGPSTPELVAAVSNAGGLGILGAAYMSPEDVARAIRKIRGLTAQPFGVNLFAGGYPAVEAHAGPMLELMGDVHEELGLDPPAVPVLGADPFPAQFEAVLEGKVPVFSFTFGIPSHGDLERLRERFVAVLGTATSLEEARLLQEAGVDGIVAQGEEAGGHRGTFRSDAMLATHALVESMAELGTPVIAAGGIMDGHDIREMLGLGAAAAQLGTAFLACPESGASNPYKLALLEAKADSTVITRAFSGRNARGLQNAFIARTEGMEEDILPYPLQNVLTRPMRMAAAQRGDSGLLSLWAGRGVGRLRVMPAGELVKKLIEETQS